MTSPPPRPDRSAVPPWVPAAGLLVLVQALLLTLVHTPAPHPGGDNMAYLSLGWALASGLGYVEIWDPGWVDHAKYPPLFPALLAVFIALGAEHWAVFKFLVAGLVSVAVLLVFLWGVRRHGVLAGGALAGLAILSAGWLEASRWILSEPLFLVMVFGTLWLSGRAGLDGSRAAAGREETPERGGKDAGGGSRSAPVHSALATAGVVAGGLGAFMTRTAGLPLLVAVLLLLVVQRRFRAAALGGVAAALVLGAWMLRARDQGEGAYQSEFWMANPYDPTLGTIGPVGILERVWTNLGIYVGSVLPGEWWGGAPEGLLWAGGLFLAGLALGGWLRRMIRRQVGVAEVFWPLYVGLILVWPEVWSGDRFILPLYPLLLLWAGEALAAATRGVQARVAAPTPGGRVRARRTERSWPPLAVVMVATAALGAPAVSSVLSMASDASVCRTVGSTDPFQCLGAPMVEFRAAAAWSGAHLPDDAVVLNRKPRIFRALNGRPGRVFPFSRDPSQLLTEADELGARYLLVDAVDGISAAYLPAVIQGAPGAFCWINAWGDYTDLLGILPPELRDGGATASCPPEYLREDSRVEPGIGGGATLRSPTPPDRVPLLSRPRRPPPP